MTNQTKSAYRHLLYVAMLATRNYCQPRARRSLNPLAWWRQYRSSRIAGQLADWLHNLAMFSSLEFAGFDENHFWHEHTLLCRHHPEIDFKSYREIFDDCLSGKRHIC